MQIGQLATTKPHNISHPSSSCSLFNGVFMLGFSPLPSCRFQKIQLIISKTSAPLSNLSEIAQQTKKLLRRLTGREVENQKDRSLISLANQPVIFQLNHAL